MRKLLLVLAVAAIGLSNQAQAAGPASRPFNVTVNLTSVCQLSAVADVAFTYSSFQTTVSAAAGGGFTAVCTGSLPYSVGFTNTASPATTATGTFSSVNLAYSLGLSAATGSGNGVAQQYNITGTMAAGQVGTCSTSTCADTDSSKTLYVVY